MFVFCILLGTPTSAESGSTSSLWQVRWSN